MAEAIMERPIPTGEGLTFEKVWAMFQEDREQARIASEQAREQARIASEQANKEWEKIREQGRIASEKFDKAHEKAMKDMEEIREQSRETDKLITKISREADERLKKIERIVKQNSRQMGGLHRSFGEMAEHLVAPGIEKRFNELEFHFSETAPKGHKIKDVDGRILTEIDILLENGEYVIAVEVKVRPEIEDIDHHIKRLQILRESRKSRKDERVILGAIAGAIFEDDVKEAVQKTGFFAIVQSGDTMKIEMPEGWKPVEF
jgi:hypothetical protein